jgi:hypothetical protein
MEAPRHGRGVRRRILTAQLARAGVLHVVGLDLDRGVLDGARRRHLGVTAEWVLQLHGRTQRILPRNAVVSTDFVDTAAFVASNAC